MKLWMRKTLVVLFTIVTFGLVSPPAALMADKPSGQPSSLEQNDYTAFMMSMTCTMMMSRKTGKTLNCFFNRTRNSSLTVLRISPF